MAVYDLCIVGAGMIGSAAARHASLVPGLKVCLIGPSEPKEQSPGDQRDILGAYYDEGRIFQMTARNMLWATVYAESVKRYGELEQSTGISFQTKVGILQVYETGDVEFDENIATAKEQSVPIQTPSLEQMTNMFPYIKTSSRNAQFLEENNSGYINPRKLVKVEQVMARSNGCIIKDDIVSEIQDGVRYRGESLYGVTTDSGEVFYTRKVLLATGAFTNSRRLLPPGVVPDIKLHGKTVLLAEVSDQDRQRMRNMPCMVYRAPQPGVVETEPEVSCYILPPILYPDGKYYIKIGHRGDDAREIELGNDELGAWYYGGDHKEMQEYLKHMLNVIFPDLKPLSLKFDRCVTTRTPQTRPYIDLLVPDFGVALGENGQSAGPCDELGRMAADLVITGQWNHGLPREWFTFKEKTASKI